MALLTSYIYKSDRRKIAIPWFIIWFVVAIVVNTYLLSDMPQIGQFVSSIARKLLILTMFFIGASMSKDAIKTVGIKSLFLGIILWLVISVVSLAYIVYVI